MSSTDYEVAIVGGGPCGLLTALLLARRGVRCGVFERRTEPLQHPKSMVISRRTSEIFQQLGLRDAMSVEDHHTRDFPISIWMESFTGEIWGVNTRPANDPATVPYPALHCPQPLTESVLLDALEREDTASIFFDHEVMSLTEKADTVRLTVHRGRHDQTFEIGARYVVAADGAASPVRHWLAIDAEGPGDQGHFLNTFFRAPFGPHLRDRRAVLTQVLRKDLFELFVSVNGDDLWLMHHFLMPGETPADYSAEKLAAIVTMASGLPEVPVEILGISPWVMSPKVAAQFRKGRVFLTGDAAARLSPAGGLGMNTGLQSAHNLAWKLAAVLRGAPDALLDTYDKERRAHVLRTFEASGRLGGEYGEIIEAGLAEDFARVRALVSESRRAGSGLGLDLGFHYPAGAFMPENGSSDATDEDMDAYRPDAAPGHRAPHLWLEYEGRRLSILDRFGNSLALVVAGNPAPWQAAIDPLASHYGFDLEITAVGMPDGYGDPEGRFLDLYGLNPGGAVLVRPDGVVGWRGRTAAGDALPGALARIFGDVC